MTFWQRPEENRLVTPMRRHNVFVAVCGALFLMGCIAPAFSVDNMKAFPPAEAGMTRYVIDLLKQEDETAFKVELIVGKTVQTDAENRYFFGGTLKTETISGWGFPRYILRELGPLAGTRMAIDPDAPKVERFIQLGGEPQLIRYNSRLPIVVYVPDGVEVRHRIWHAETTSRFVQKVALPGGQTAVVAEGDFEARSIGSYSIRTYSGELAQAGDDTTFFSSGIVLARDGTVEKVCLADLGESHESSLIVVIRSAGSGGYVSANAFTIGRNCITLCASVSGLPADADPLVELNASLRNSEKK